MDYWTYVLIEELANEIGIGSKLSNALSKESLMLQNKLSKPLSNSPEEQKRYDSIEKLAKELHNKPHNTYAKGGEVNKTIENLKKGDTIKIKFGSAVSRDNNVTLKVRSRNKVRKGTIEKITFENVNNPKGNKFYAYERGDGIFRFAMGDMAITNIELISSYAKGGNVGRDAKFLSEQSWEQDYKPKRKRPYKRYKK